MKDFCFKIHLEYSIFEWLPTDFVVKKLLQTIGIFVNLVFVSTVLITGQVIQYDYLNQPAVIPGIQVNVIHKSANGFIWFGTEQGLVKYDGYEHVTYDNIHGNSNSLSYLMLLI